MKEKTAKQTENILSKIFATEFGLQRVSYLNAKLYRIGRKSTDCLDKSGDLLLNKDKNRTTTMIISSCDVTQ